MRELATARHTDGGRVRDANGRRVSFVHDDPEFGDLLRIVAGETRIAPGLVEKDYWVTHTLWALHHAVLLRLVQGRHVAIQRLRTD